jgi:hypothetical protein
LLDIRRADFDTLIQLIYRAIFTARNRNVNRNVLTSRLQHGDDVDSIERSESVPQSVLDAIKMGIWDFEPESSPCRDFPATQALPGSEEKLMVLARRVQQGLPLWHPRDRRSYSEGETT